MECTDSDIEGVNFAIECTAMMGCQHILAKSSALCESEKIRTEMKEFQSFVLQQILLTMKHQQRHTLVHIQSHQSILSPRIAYISSRKAA
jgi:uncharacterized protein YqkB